MLLITIQYFLFYRDKRAARYPVSRKLSFGSMYVFLWCLFLSADYFYTSNEGDDERSAPATPSKRV
jgi:hypothetical protein